MKKISIIAFAMFSLFSCIEQKTCEKSSNVITTEIPQREEGQTDVIGLTAAPIDTVRIGFIGLGQRGPGAVERMSHVPGTKIVALCDIVPENVEKVQKYLKDNNLPAAAEYSGDSEIWKKLCERDDIDLVYICTDWKMHVPMAVYAMEQGKHTAMEVPATTSLDECWQMVNIAEKTKLHCMMLENCCYDFFELTTLNMAQKGLLGELVHVEGAYIHDLRFLNFDEKTGYHDMWRLEHNTNHDGNPYPTHGLGPIAQALNINRGDKMEYLVSLSSDQFGMTEYAKNHFPADSKYNKTDYAKGDMNSTLIKTNKGKSILIQHDVTSPRPYNRKHSFSGTKGYIEKYPREGIALEPDAHGFVSPERHAELLKEYEHPLIKEVGEIAKKVGGHGGMDYIMDYRLIYCLRNGLPLDMNVYDGALWSSIAPLSEISVNNNSAPVAVPDFTRGAWEKEQGFKHAGIN